ncbi:unnamed protein product [Rotaria sordida]|uniref:ceramidase n=1 Tax=Rotaria sordida TaxID=392033 RepID=A0A815SJ95_9BILA|nr:unnamed protein product [Rotaria sordida]
MSNNTWILTEKLRTLITQINFTRNGEVLFKTTSFAGYIGVLTGLKPNVFSISVNSRTSFHDGYEGQDHVTFESLFNVLSSRPMLNALTIYSTLMELSTGRYETYWQRCRNEDAP